MNKRYYEHTLPIIRGSLSNTYFSPQRTQRAQSFNSARPWRVEDREKREKKLLCVLCVLCGENSENYGAPQPKLRCTVVGKTVHRS